MTSKKMKRLLLLTVLVTALLWSSGCGQDNVVPDAYIPDDWNTQKTYTQAPYDIPPKVLDNQMSVFGWLDEEEYYELSSQINSIILGGAPIRGGGGRKIGALGKITTTEESSIPESAIQIGTVISESNFAFYSEEGLDEQYYLEFAYEPGSTTLSIWGDEYSFEDFSWVSRYGETVFFNFELSEKQVSTIMTSKSTERHLVSKYSFENIQGKTVIDSAGKNNGTIAGNTRLMEGEYNHTVAFENLADAIVVKHEDSLNFSEEMTVSFWMNPINSPDVKYSPQYILHKGYKFNSSNVGTQDNFEIVFYYGYLIFSWTDAKSGRLNSAISKPLDIAFGNWRNVALTVNSDGVKFYINGELFDEKYQKVNMKPCEHDMVIGSRAGKSANSNGFYGQLDEISLYDRSLTAKEIKALYESIFIR